MCIVRAQSRPYWSYKSSPPFALAQTCLKVDLAPDPLIAPPTPPLVPCPTFLARQWHKWLPGPKIVALTIQSLLLQCRSKHGYTSGIANRISCKISDPLTAGAEILSSNRNKLSYPCLLSWNLAKIEWLSQHLLYSFDKDRLTDVVQLLCKPSLSPVWRSNLEECFLMLRKDKVVQT